MSRSTLAPAPAPATPAPSPAVSLDPVTGAVVSTPMACCTPPSKSSPSHLQPSTVTTHPPSDAYLTTVYSVLGLAVAAGLGYAAYRYYTDVYAANSRVAGLRGIVEKRAAYPVKEVADERLLDQAINEAQANLAPGQRLFVLVEGAHDPSTGLSWCGDCVTADPILERVLSEEKACVSLIRAPVQRAAYKGNAAHPYRNHPQLQLQRIPTLYRLSPGGVVVDQLIETELHDIQTVRRFVKQQ